MAPIHWRTLMATLLMFPKLKLNKSVNKKQFLVPTRRSDLIIGNYEF